jgi:2-amino-4-hydroxy-6-hydroxymethyldihydropteridine diphosphokinase
MDLSGNPPGEVLAYVGLGANLGDALAALRAAVQELGGIGVVVAVSPVYESDPVGRTDQPAFTNAVAAIETPLSPEDLLAALHRIEAGHGRTREIHWGPRTLDLDLLWYGGRRRDAPDPVLPHPRAHEREFVLRPLCDLDPSLELHGRPVAELLAELPPQGVRPTGAGLMPA